METKEYKLGVIELGNRAYVSDPCYGLNTWCQKVLNIKPGKYYGFVEKSDEGKWGLRVSKIWAIHEDYLDRYPSELVTDAEIGVDSGQAGIFDGDYYEKYHKDQSDSYPHADEDWYDNLCDQGMDYDIYGNPFIEDHYELDKESFTMKRIPSGQERRDFCNVDGKCIVSSSGYGDGCYELYVSRDDDNNIVGMMIVFINGDVDDEYYEDDEDPCIPE